MKKTVLVIQAPEYSQEYREKQYRKHHNLPPEAKISFCGIDDAFQTSIVCLKKLEKDDKLILHQLGNGKTDLEFAKIRPFLEKYSSKQDEEGLRPLIIVVAHGIESPQQGIKCHIISLDAENEELVYTSDIFTLIADTIKSPVDVVLCSCQSGSALKTVHLLPAKSKLLSFTNDNSDIQYNALSNALEKLPQDAELNLENIMLLACSRGISPVVVSSGLCYSGLETPAPEKKYQLSIEELKLIYGTLTPLGYSSEVQKMLEGKTEIDDSVLSQLRQYTQLQLKYNNLVINGTDDASLIQKYHEQMKPYSPIDRAILVMIQGNITQEEIDAPDYHYGNTCKQYPYDLINMIRCTLHLHYIKNANGQDVDALSTQVGDLSIELRMLYSGEHKPLPCVCNRINELISTHAMDIDKLDTTDELSDVA